MRKGMEMSINFLVVLILGIAMLSLGIWLLGDFFGSLHEFDKAISEREKEQMLTLIGDRDVMIYPETLTISTGKTNSFLIGVHNRLPGPSKEFIPIVRFKYAIDKTEVDICDETSTGTCSPSAPGGGDPNLWLLPMGSLPVENTETGVFKLIVKVPKGIRSGNYLFEVCVEDPTGPGGECIVPGGQIYGKRATITVRVP